MTTEIVNLSGYFDGYVYHRGLVSISIENGIIKEVTPQQKIESNPTGINGEGKIASVPFVDGHTHLIFAGNRSFELPLKVNGATYAEILENGGGILTTVRNTREASDKELLNLVLKRLDIMMANGTYIVEAKSGYGLDAEEEIRQLRILNEADKLHPVKVIPTYCGAHALPPNKKREDYVEEVISILDEVRPLATTTDVFCDRGAFNVEETMKILKASMDAGIPVKVHADELEYTGIGKLAAKEFNAYSADHLLKARGEDFEALARSGTVAMFMPAAPIGLFSSDRPQGWKDVEGLKIGLGTDFNPNNLVYSMQTAIRLAVYLYRMDPLEAIKAATSGSYYGITKEELPKLREGAPANFVLLNGISIEDFVTQFDQNTCSQLFINGKPMI